MSKKASSLPISERPAAAPGYSGWMTVSEFRQFAEELRLKGAVTRTEALIQEWTEKVQNLEQDPEAEWRLIFARNALVMVQMLLLERKEELERFLRGSV